MTKKTPIQALDSKDYIPSEVKDVEAYNKYLKLVDELAKKEGRYHQTSDPDIIVDLCTTPYIIKKKVSHLPIEEYDNLVELTHPWRSLLGQMAAAKRQAYGRLTKQDDDSHLGVIEARQSELIEYFGKFYTSEEVYKIVTVDWGFETSVTALTLFYRRNIEKIKELQEQYKLDVTDIRLHHKRSRLDELQMMFNKRKQKYEQDESISNEKQLQSLLESIKKEVEGDLVIQGRFQVELEEKIHYQVEQELLKDFNVTAVVISRIAGKMGINPLFLLTRLANSRYARFAGFANNNIPEAEIVPAPNVSYDMTKIVALAKKVEFESNILKALPEVPKPDMEKAKSIREQLLNELRDKEVTVSQTTNIQKLRKNE